MYYICMYDKIKTAKKKTYSLSVYGEKEPATISSLQRY